MKCQITGKNIEVTESIRYAIENKLHRMDKYFVIDEDVEARVLVRTYKESQKVEITIFTKMMDFRVEVKDDDLYAAVDLAIDKLEGQMRKLKTKLSHRHKENLGRAIAFDNFKSDEEDSANDEVVRVKELDLEPMDMEVAITKMEALNHSFFVYLDSEDDKISILYRREDKGYGVLQVNSPGVLLK